jgi:hypothetical protein
VARGRGKRKGGGRRANYAPAASEVGYGRFVPIGWANWLGFVLFGVITIALFVEAINATIEDRGNDNIAAAVMCVVFAVMTYLFATTRVKDV